MSLIGVEMLFFLPAAWGVYWMLPRSAAIQNAWLLLLSMVFYASWGPQLLPVFLAWASIDYAVGSALAWKSGRKNAAVSSDSRSPGMSAS